MASYPGSIFSPRAVANRAGVVYDADKTKVFFAKDHNDFGNEIVAIQNVLGIDFDKTFREVSKGGLVLAMNFNSESIDGSAGSEKVLDSSGHNNHGVNHGADHDPDGGFNDGGAFDFVSANSDFLSIPHNANLNFGTGDFAVSVWVKTSTLVNTTVINKITANTVRDGYGLFFRSNRHVWVQDTRGLAGVIDIAFTYDDGVYHHYLITNNSGTIKLFIDGVEKGSASWTADVSVAQNLTLGRNSYQATGYFNGLIDEPRIYNRALSADEIRNLYKARKEIHNPFVSQKNVLVNPDGSIEFLNNAFDADGQKLMSGDARVIRHLRVGAASWNGGGVAPTQGFDGLWVYLAFDKLSDDSGHFILIIPSRWDISTDVEFIVDWYYTGAQDNGTVCWGLEYKSIKGGEVVTGAGTIISKVSAGSHLTGKMVRTTFTAKILHGNLEEGDTIGLRLFRDVSEGTLDTDAKLLNTHFRFTQNKLGDAI